MYMRRLFHRAAIAVLPALLITIPVQEAKAQWAVTDWVTEANTWLSHVTQLLQYIREAQQALQAVQMATMMTREVKQLATHPSTNIAADLATFSGILAQSQGLAGNLAQMSVTFQNQFQPYSPSPMVNWASQYNTWASTALKTIQGSAMGMGYQGNMLQNENQWMQTINQMNSNPQGQDESLQLANTIGIQTVSQLMNLRQLMLANANANNAIQATAINAQQAQVAVTQTGFGTVNWVADPRGW
jgi:P-type conjugative transfer protein TrbJ